MTLCSGTAGAFSRDASPCSASFRQLLSAIRDEHERQVSRLLGEVHTLRAARGEHKTEFPTASEFSGVVPCAPLTRPRPKSTASKAGPAALGAGTGERGGAALPCAPFLCAVRPPPWSSRRTPLPPEPNGVPRCEPKDQEELSPKVLSPSAHDSGPAVSVQLGRSFSSSFRMRSSILHEIKLRQAWVNPSLPQTNGEGLESVWLQDAPVESSLSRASRTSLLPVCLVPSPYTYLPLHPTSRIKMAWDIIAPFALLYDFVTIPLQVFNFQETFARHVVEGVILFYWIIDILIAFNAAYLTDSGDIVREYRLIARKYVRTWFFPDILITGSDVATTGMAWAVDENTDFVRNMGVARMGKLLRVMRVIRILRFGRIGKLREVIYRVQVYFDSEAISIAWGLCLNIFTLLVLNHITACLWYWIGSGDHQYTWLTVPFEDGRTWAAASSLEAYFVSLHWSLTLFTPASMAVQPENVYERIYAVMCLILAMVVFASFVSTVTAGMTRLRHIQAESVEQCYKLRKFLRENRISADLAFRVQRYVDIAMLYHQKRVPKDDVVRLKWLSGPLNVELMCELSAPTLRTHCFFLQYSSCSVAAMRQLCFSAITVHPVSKRDTLFSSFEEASRMFFVKSGRLVYKRAKGLPFPRRVEMSKYHWFVEHVLWIQWVHHGTTKALTESELMGVDAEQFRQVSVAHPDVLVLCQEYAAAFVQRVRERSACDLPSNFVGRQRLEGSKDNVDPADSISFSSDSDSFGEAV